MKLRAAKAALIGAVASAAVVLPLAGSAAAETNLRPHVTNSFLECQTLGNQLAQKGWLAGFNCVQEGNHVIMYPW
ncbi:hypothetical protein RKD28_004669 [Streptomyces sp. SAI-229]|jgi:hypothetical protein